MYHSFTVENFRGFKHLTVEPLDRINLIAGKNNVGKTALLEALWLHHGYHNPSLGPAIDAFRGLERVRKEEFLWDLFKGFDPQNPIVFSSLDSNDRQRTLKIAYQERLTSRVVLGEEGKGDGKAALPMEVVGQESTKAVEAQVIWESTVASGDKIRALATVQQDGIEFTRAAGVKEPDGIFLAARHREGPEALAERFSNVAVGKRLEQIIEVMQIVERDLVDLTIQHRGGAPLVFGDVQKSRLIPLALMGDGMGRLLNMALAISNARDGLVLVDEIENGLHHTIMQKVWEAIGRLARDYNTQLFATTHNVECISAAHRAFSQNGQYDFRLHRLEWIKGEIRAVTYDEETLEAALETGLETR